MKIVETQNEYNLSPAFLYLNYRQWHIYNIKQWYDANH